MNTWYKQGEELALEIESSRCQENELYIWFLGQCGFLFKSQSLTFLIDPVLNDLLDNNQQTKRLYPHGLDPKKIQADYVLCTHAHRDHMAVQTLQKILKANPGCKIIAPQQAAFALKEQGFDESALIAAKANQTIAEKHITIHPVQTLHPERIKEGEDERSLAYVIDTDSVRLMHLGDTYLDARLISDLKAYSHPDLFMPPVNGKDYYRDARGCIGNLNSYEAARLASEVQADLSVPCHYDMMKGNTCSPLPFIEQMLAEHPKGKVGLPKLGERMLIQKK